MALPRSRSYTATGRPPRQQRLAAPRPTVARSKNKKNRRDTLKAARQATLTQMQFVGAPGGDEEADDDGLEYEAEADVEAAVEQEKAGCAVENKREEKAPEAKKERRKTASASTSASPSLSSAKKAPSGRRTTLTQMAFFVEGEGTEEEDEEEENNEEYTASASDFTAGSERDSDDGRGADANAVQEETPAPVHLRSWKRKRKRGCEGADGAEGGNAADSTDAWPMKRGAPALEPSPTDVHGRPPAQKRFGGGSRAIPDSDEEGEDEEETEDYRQGACEDNGNEPGPELPLTRSFSQATTVDGSPHSIPPPYSVTGFPAPNSASIAPAALRSASTTLHSVPATIATIPTVPFAPSELDLSSPVLRSLPFSSQPLPDSQLLPDSIMGFELPRLPGWSQGSDGG